MCVLCLDSDASGRVLGAKGCFGLSTYSIGEVSDTSDCPPLLMVHGDEDEVLALSFAKASFERLHKRGLCATFKTLPELAHTVDMRVVEEVARFIAVHKQ